MRASFDGKITQHDTLNASFAKKYEMAFHEVKGNPLHSKISRKIKKIEIPEHLNPIRPPQINYLSDQEMINKNASYKESYSVYVAISKDRMDIWVNNNLRDKGLSVIDLKAAIRSGKKLIEDEIHKPVNESMNAIHRAAANLSQHRLFIYLPEKVHLSLPIYIEVFPDPSEIFLPIHLINLIDGESSGLEIISIRSPHQETNDSFLNLVIETEVAAGSKFESVEVQNLENQKCVFSAYECANIQKNAAYRKFIYDRGSFATIRSFATGLKEDGGTAIITGIYSTKDKQRFIYDTSQNHYASHTSSDLLFKGVLAGNSDVLWKGNVVVERGTYGADGYQMNNNLLLDSAAHAESIPGLEILTDDVRCSHGVTLSAIDADQLFYLKTRGVDEKVAIDLIVRGFLETTLARIHSDLLRGHIEDQLYEML